MKKNENGKKWIIVVAVLIGCCGMIWIEAIWQPTYLYKSVCKILVFTGCIGWYCWSAKDYTLLQIFRVSKGKELCKILLLGIAVYGGILGAYWIAQNWIDFHGISESLSSKENISAENFIYVAVYISLINSLLEELFFRGFAFLELRKYCTARFAYVFSAASFACYHIFIMAGWFTPILFLLLLGALAFAGLFFNWLDRKGKIYPSWIVHMAANLAINTIGLMMFQIL